MQHYPDISPGSTDAERSQISGDLEELRRLLLAKEIEAISHLEQRLDNQDNHAREISEVVAEAILLRTQKDDTLISVLQGTVEHIFNNNLRRNPVGVVDHLFPVIGPAIRRSISEVFRSMLQSFNKSLELSFSWKGLRWRLEALRTGRPFSEIVLLNTLIYRVEQIFLVHTETGILLDQLAAEGIQAQDADLVSGMLTAVQQFVMDSFGQGENDTLESMQMGERTIFVARNAQMYLACVVRGATPASLVQQMHVALELITFNCGDALHNFQGDSSGFQTARRHLEELLISRFADEDKKLPMWLRLLPLTALLLMAGCLGYLKYKESSYLHTIYSLSEEPGIVVTMVHSSMWSSPWNVFILRDDLAKDPAEILHAAGISHGDVVLHTSPYIALDEPIIRARVSLAIAPPEGVNIHFDNSRILHLSGQAPMHWIAVAREKALAIPGVKAVDTSNLIDPIRQEFDTVMARVNGVTILFSINKDTPTLAEESAKLTKAVDDLVLLEKLATRMDMGVSLIIYGHADALGSDKRNYEISLERAKTIAALLYARGSSIPISTYGFGAEHAKRPDGHAVADANSRKIELRVHLVNAPTSHLGEGF